MTIYIHDRRKLLLMVCDSVKKACLILGMSEGPIRRGVNEKNMIGGEWYVTSSRVVSMNWQRRKPAKIEVPGKHLMTYYPSRFSDRFGGYRELYGGA